MQIIWWCTTRIFCTLNRNSGAIRIERLLYYTCCSLNINIQDNGYGHKQLLSVTNIYNLIMTINTPTRATESMATIIYQIITNKPAQCYSTDAIHTPLCTMSHHY